MTLPPERIGYNGQKYEILCRDEDEEIVVIGWSDDPNAFAKAVRDHPTWHGRHVIEADYLDSKGEWPDQ